MTMSGVDGASSQTERTLPTLPEGPLVRGEIPDDPSSSSKSPMASPATVPTVFDWVI